MTKTRKVRNGFLFGISTGVGIGAAIGGSFVPQVETLMVGGNTAINMLIVAGLFLGAFAIAFGAIYLILRKFAGKSDTKSFEKVVIAKSAVAQGMVPSQDIKTITKEQKAMNKAMNKKAFARRNYEKAMKNDDKF